PGPIIFQATRMPVYCFMTLLSEMLVSIAQFFVSKYAMWDHPTGRWVSAPKHAERIENGRYGWEIEFGANKFLVGRAIEKCTNYIRDLIYQVEQGHAIESGNINSQLGLIIRSCVANYEGEIFEGYYSVERNLLRFGTQGINIETFKSYIIGTTEIDKIAK
ncbi:hypothetical protein KQ940_22295, partial [Marinobacterium sp. D7]|uniref:hypothetical protein n=1 Tax=Marinobacterium ramblicola TaxID=2849041 RepID=UPI001C2D697F